MKIIALRQYKHINIVAFIYCNFLKKNVIRDRHCFIWTYGKTKIRLSKDALLTLHGNLKVNVDDESAFSKHIQTAVSILDRGHLEIYGNCRICGNVDIRVKHDGRLVLNQTYINRDTRIICGKEIVFGKNSGCSYGCYISDMTEHSRSIVGSGTEYVGAPISIGNNVWIGAYSIIRYGVSIGEDAVIGVGSYLSNDIPGHTATMPVPSSPIFAGDKLKCHDSDKIEESTKPLPAEADEIVLKIKSELQKILNNDNDWTEEDNLLEGGYIDSLRLVSVTMMLEKEFGITVPLEELNGDNYKSVNSMADMVCRIKENNIKQNVADGMAYVTKTGVITWNKLTNGVNAIAKYLSETGIQKGQNVLIQTKCDICFIVLVMALQRLGAIPVPIEKLAGKERLDEIVNRIQATWVVSDYTDFVCKCISWYDLKDKLNKSQNEFARIYNQSADVEEDDICQILYTTGTTGKSKGVVVTYNEERADIETSSIELVPDSQAILSTFPLNHSMGIKCGLYFGLHKHSVTVLADGFTDIQWIFEKIKEYDVGTLFIPPIGIKILLPFIRSNPQIISNLKRIVVAGSKISGKEIREIQKIAKVEVIDCYGTSESGIVSFVNYKAEEQLPEGKLRKGVDVQILTLDGVMSNQRKNQGQICIHSSSIMKGYYNDDALSDKVMNGEWFVTGDLGYFDENGVLTVMGRSNDIIDLGGLKVNPEEIENCIIESGLAIDCICFGQEDEFGYPYLKLIVVTDSISSDKYKIKKCIETNFGSQFVPMLVEQSDSIMRTYNGKKDRKYYNS